MIGKRLNVTAGWKWMLMFLLLGLLFVSLTACSGETDNSSGQGEPVGDTVNDKDDHSAGTQAGNEDAAESEEEPNEPVTLTVHSVGVSEEEFDRRFSEVIATNLPHITIDYIQAGSGTYIQDLVAQKSIPDIMRIDIPGMKANYLDLELAYGLEELIDKYDYDIGRFNPTFIDDIIQAGGTGELYGLPVPPYFPLVLYYNVDVFDKFGVDYPVDGMTWDEVYELARTMTRSDGDEITRGFSASVTAMLRDNPYSHPILDPNEDRLADHEIWQAMFNNLSRFFAIPNNQMENSASAEIAAFSNGNVAMMGNQHNIYLVIPEEINWDIVSYPVMEGAPKLMGQRSSAYWSITRQSEHKDAAFQVITQMLSDEVQMQDSKQGIPTTLVNEEIKNALGQDHEVYSTKNMNAVNVYEPASPAPRRNPELIDVPGRTQEAIIFEAFRKVVIEGTDVNTALREAEEQLLQELELQKK